MQLIRQIQIESQLSLTNKPIVKMADLEAVLADVSYLMAMEKSKSTPAARASKKIILPDPRYMIHLVYLRHQAIDLLRLVCVVLSRKSNVSPTICYIVFIFS